MERRWRLILDAERDGYYNMAVDEAILLNYQSQRIPTLRIYGWSEPFITFGYNQRPEDVLKPENTTPYLRRITGGSSILHQEELTYSVTCALEDLGLTAKVKESYRVICGFLIDFYRRLSILVSYAKDSDCANLGQHTPFCFSSWQEYDLIAAGKKIGGNAQRRKHNLIFQHVSIPLELDFDKISSSIKASLDASSRATSIRDLLGHYTSFSALAAMLREGFEKTFGLNLYRDVISPQEENTAANILKNQKQANLFEFSS